MNSPMALFSQTPIFLQCLNLAKTYHQTIALGGINLEFRSGELVAIMGPSGSGKSTLLNCLAGIIPPSTGQIWYQGQEISQLRDHKRAAIRSRNFGFVQQKAELLEELTVLENIALPLLLNGENRRKSYLHAEDWAEKLNIAQLLPRRIDEISGGQQQLACIARALVNTPQVIFADEPTGALDLTTGQTVMQFLTTVAKQKSITLILVTHDPKVAAWANRLIKIRDGLVFSDSLIQENTAQEIIADEGYHG